MLFCSKCKLLKEESSFHRRNTIKRGFSDKCKDCSKIVRKEYYIKNKNKELKNCKLYQKVNKDKISNWSRSYRKEYAASHKKQIASRLKEYFYKKRRLDVGFKLKGLLRHRVLESLKFNRKSDNTMNLIGCSINRLKEYLQETAIKNGYTNFDINNYSGKEYHIDHIVPCKVFNLSCSFHQKLCFNYENLQILDAKSNIIKNDKFNED